MKSCSEYLTGLVDCLAFSARLGLLVLSSKLYWDVGEERLQVEPTALLTLLSCFHTVLVRPRLSKSVGVAGTTREGSGRAVKFR